MAGLRTTPHRNPDHIASSDAWAALINGYLDVLRSDDPVPMFDAFRMAPVQRTSTGVWLVTQYAPTIAVLSHRAMSSNPSAAGPMPVAEGHGADGTGDSALRSSESRVILFLDPPDHTVVRRIVSHGLANAATAVRVDAAARLRAFDRSAGELVKDVVIPVATNAVCDLVGLPRSASPVLAVWARATSDALDPGSGIEEIRRAQSSGMRTMTLIKRSVDAGPPPGSLLAELGWARAEGLIDEREQLANAVSVVSAGSDTVLGLLTMGTLAMVRRPDLVATLGADRSLLRPFIDEIVRLESPAQMTVRTVCEAVTFPFASFARGDTVVVLLGCANRDPAAFADADQIRLDRSEPTPVGFGWGPHRCVGAAVAHTIGAEFFGALLDYWKFVSIADAGHQHRNHSVFRSMDLLLTGPGVAATEADDRSSGRA